MAQIEVIRDPNIELEPIIHALRSADEQEDPEVAEDNPSENIQTKVFGILTPLLAINGISVDFGDCERFELDYTSHIPTVKFAFKDKDSKFKNLSQPGNDAELRVEILPPFDDAYKKINLAFAISNISVNNGSVSGEGTYKLMPFTKSIYKALGEKTTYELCDQISLETGLGFASNVGTTDDKRFMQCQYESYKDVIDREMEKSMADEVTVYDWWVDVWNNLILCNLYDRVQSEDTDEDMMIWVASNENTASVNEEVVPVQTQAIFSNHLMYEKSDMYVLDYEVDNNPVSQSTGNSVVMSVYEENKKDWMSHYVTDGDIKKNVYEKIEYMGEVYGDYNYFVAEKARELYLNKIKSEVVVIHTEQPQFAIMRGDQLRFVWYDADEGAKAVKDALEEGGAIKDNEQLELILGWVKDWDLDNYVPDNPMTINTQFSGQYTCIGQYLSYDSSRQVWDNWIYLTRPADKRPIISNITDEGDE